MRGASSAGSLQALHDLGLRYKIAFLTPVSYERDALL